MDAVARLGEAYEQYARMGATLSDTFGARYVQRMVSREEKPMGSRSTEEEGHLMEESLKEETTEAEHAKAKGGGVLSRVSNWFRRNDADDTAEEGADDGSAHGAADHAGMVEAEGDCEFRARHCHMYVALHERDGRGAKYKKQWVVLDEGLLLCYNTPPATQSDMTLREVEDDEEEDREVCPGNTLCTAQRLLNELQV